MAKTVFDKILDTTTGPKSSRTSSVVSSTPPIRPGGYEHPRLHKYVSVSNNMRVNNVHDQDFQLACVQTYLYSFYMIA